VVIAAAVGMAAVIRGAGPLRGVTGYPAIVGPTRDHAVPIGLVQAALLALLVATAVALLGAAWLRGAGRRLGGTDAAGALDPVPADPATGDTALPSATATWRAVRALVLGGGVLAGVGGVVASLAPDAASAGGVLAVAGGAALLLGAGLVPSLARAVERRIALAQQAETARPVRLPGQRRRTTWLVLAAILVVGGASPVPGTTRSVVEVADTGHPCSGPAGWTCTVIQVPADRPSEGMLVDPGITLDLAFVVHAAPHPPAAGRRALVYATGGPGSDGLDAAEDLAAFLDDRVVDTTDLVVYDPRGTGKSSRVRCPAAARAWDASDRGEVAARAFARDCPSEADVIGDELRRYASTQVAEDIDAIRVHLGLERIVVYGSSYGTVVAQAYAAAHPDRVELLVLDAPIDRTLHAHDMWIQAADGYLDAMHRTFEACSVDTDCRASLPDPEATYRRLAAALDEKVTLSAEVRTTTGEKEWASITRRQLDDLSAAAMYSTFDRMLWLRALAAYQRGDLRPLVTLSERWGGYGGGSDFTYFATWCADTPKEIDGPDGGLGAFRAQVDAAGMTDPGARSIADVLAPCLYWPVHAGSADAPPDAIGVPTVVLTSTQDPVTRTEGARAIAGRLADGWLVETSGGDHGSIQVPCAQRVVASVLVDGGRPASRTTRCVDSAVDEFVPLAPRPATTADDAVLGVLWELTSDPRFLAWDGVATLRIPCSEDGFLELSPPGGGHRSDLELDGCSYAAGTALDGTGWLDAGTYDVSLTVTAGRGDLRLVWVGGSWRMTGHWDGAAVEE
jgi:pimeloyl-ACP methyl ester carboxylesterase